MGMDLFMVADFIDNAGLCEMNMSILTENINNPMFRCPLLTLKVRPPSLAQPPYQGQQMMPPPNQGQFQM